MYLFSSQRQLRTFRLDVRPSLPCCSFLFTLLILLLTPFVLLLGAAGAAAAACLAFPFLTLAIEFLLGDRRPVKQSKVERSKK